MRLADPEVDAGLLDDLVPAIYATLAIGYVVIQQAAVDGAQRRHFLPGQLAIHHALHLVGGSVQLMVVGELGFLVAALEARAEGIGAVGRDFRAEQVARDAHVEVGLALQEGQVYHAQGTDPVHVVGIGDAGLVHRGAGGLDGAAHAGLADEQMVRLLGQHEAA